MIITIAQIIPPREKVTIPRKVIINNITILVTITHFSLEWNISLVNIKKTPNPKIVDT